MNNTDAPIELVNKVSELLYRLEKNNTLSSSDCSENLIVNCIFEYLEQHPELCLKLAKVEYDIVSQKEILKPKIHIPSQFINLEKDN